VELATLGAFSATAAALQTQTSSPQWSLLSEELSILCQGGQLQFDLGAIGKGFALDRWVNCCVVGIALVPVGCRRQQYSGGSSAAGDCRLVMWIGEDDAPQRFFLSHTSLSGSGLAVKGSHIF